MHTNIAIIFKNARRVKPYNRVHLGVLLKEERKGTEKRAGNREGDREGEGRAGKRLVPRDKSGRRERDG